VRSKVDHYIYSKEEDGNFIYVALYLDDMLLIGNNMDVIKEVKKQQSSKFDMKDLDETKFILGMKIKRDRATGNICLNKMKYIEIVMKHFNMQDCKPMKVPIPVGARLTVEQFPKTLEEIEDMPCVPYASLVGSLMYAMVFTRPYISHAMRVFNRYMSTPGKEHSTIFKRVFMYLCGMKNYAICYQGKLGGESGKLNVHGFFDAD
jgi:hypothetical protein